MKRILQPHIIGSLAAILFIFGSLITGYLLDNYSFVSQTLSEIGAISSPMKLPFQILKIGVSILILLLAILLFNLAKRHSLSVIPTVFLFSFGLSDLGVALFPTPLPLHNVFGLSLTLGYLTPFFFGILWGEKISKSFRPISLLFFMVILLGIFLNLSPMFNPELYPLKYYGLVQRFLVFTMFVYMAYVGRAVQRSDVQSSD